MDKIIVTKRRWMLLPVEIKARELYRNVFLACIAAELGWGSIIGKKRTVKSIQNILPHGVYIEKNMAPKRVPNIELAISAGNRVSAWNEEGLLYINKSLYIESKLKPQYFNALDYFFAWGKNEADDIIAALGYAGDKIVLSGNPRFDLLHRDLRSIYEPAAAKLRDCYGKMILINTNFAQVSNSNKSYDCLKVNITKGLITTAEQEAVLRRYLAFKRQIFGQFIDMLPVLAEKFRHHTIIVRPHPSEDHGPWFDKAKVLENVKVIYEGSANEWIQASDVLIQNNCTTGVESFLMEKPTISYRPFKDEAVEYPLVNQTSFQASDLEELLSLVSRFVDKGTAVSAEERNMQVEFAHGYIANIEGKLASERIMDTLNSLDLPEAEGYFPIKRTVKERVGQIMKQINLRNNHKYKKQKFPGIELAEIERFIEELQSITGKFKAVNIVEVDENVFCIY